MEPPAEVAAQIPRWDLLTRWERAELGRRLRRLGWTYGEIMEILPVVKGTLAGWCRDIRLTEAQIEAIKARVAGRLGVPRDTNWRRRLEVQRIKEEALLSLPRILADPMWLAGTVLYWAEGDKSSRRLSLVNSDPKALLLFVNWSRAYHDPAAEFVLALHLHHGNDEEEAKSWWQSALNLPCAPFHKTFIKPPGTGHRKNHLAHGVCRVMMRRSGDAWHRTMAWIEAVSREFESGAN